MSSRAHQSSSSSNVWAIAVLFIVPCTLPAADWKEWQFQQAAQVSADGMTRLRLPPEVLDASQAGLTDVRLADREGREVPFAFVTPRPPERIEQVVSAAANNLRTLAERERTVIEFRAAVNEPIESISLTISSARFYKSVSVSVAVGERPFVETLVNFPVFRQSAGASQLVLPVKCGGRDRVRLVFDDVRTEPVAVTQLTLHGPPRENVLAEPIELRIVEREEQAGKTRLLLDLGAARRHLARLEFAVVDPVFTRPVRLLTRAFRDGELSEAVSDTGTILRTGGPGGSARLRLDLEHAFDQREVVLVIENGDSPPLNIESIRAWVRPLHLLFVAQPGEYRVYAGNRRAGAPQYDLARLNQGLEAAVVTATLTGTLAENPLFNPADTLADVPLLGAELDIKDWSFRKPLPKLAPGVHRLQFDLDVLAHAQLGFGDVRLMSGGRQLPFLLDRSARVQTLFLASQTAPDADRPAVSRWQLSLTHARLPLKELNCVPETALFNRHITLYEVVTNLRGEKQRRQLGSANWVVTPESRTNRLRLALTSPPETDRLFLETDNGDNAPIRLTGFLANVPVTRVLFKVNANQPLDLLYGNDRVGRPSYDLGMVGAELLAAKPIEVEAGPEQRHTAEPWKAGEVTGIRAVLFWGVLIAVVGGLLFVIMKLLPKT